MKVVDPGLKYAQLVWLKVCAAGAAVLSRWTRIACAKWGMNT